MRVIISLIAIVLFTSSSCSSDVYNKTVVVKPNTREKFVIISEEILGVYAHINNISHEETDKCKYCLHIESNAFGSHNENSSSTGVGFVAVAPECGKLVIYVSHDYKTPVSITVSAKPYTGKLRDDIYNFMKENSKCTT